MRAATKIIGTAALFGLVVIPAAVLFSVSKTGKEHRAAAIEFWGGLYKPEEDSLELDWGFIGNMLRPAGGPLMDTELTEACEGTPLPMVPVRIGEGRAIEALCGLGRDTAVRTVYFEGEGRQALGDAILKSLLSAP